MCYQQFSFRLREKAYNRNNKRLISHPRCFLHLSSNCYRYFQQERKIISESIKKEFLILQNSVVLLIGLHNYQCDLIVMNFLFLDISLERISTENPHKYDRLYVI